jgi:hypothetical protein
MSGPAPVTHATCKRWWNDSIGLRMDTNNSQALSQVGPRRVRGGDAVSDFNEPRAFPASSRPSMNACPIGHKQINLRAQAHLDLSGNTVPSVNGGAIAGYVPDLPAWQHPAWQHPAWQHPAWQHTEAKRIAAPAEPITGALPMIGTS